MPAGDPRSAVAGVESKISHVQAQDRFIARTSDGQRLAGMHRAPPSGSRELALVLAHGFGGGLHRAPLQAVVGGLCADHGVLAFDFRGHGGSTGRSTLGDREALDVDAVVAAARRLGYRRVVTIGFSMGGAAVLRQAGLLGELTCEPVDAVVAVSTASRWYRRDTAPMSRLLWLVERRTGRAVARLWPGVRIDPTGWEELPPSPEQVVGRIAPVPLLLVHGDADRYFGVSNLTELRAAAGPDAIGWLVAGFGHAENAVTPQLLSRIAGQVRAWGLQEAR